MFCSRARRTEVCYQRSQGLYWFARHQVMEYMSLLDLHRRSLLLPESTYDVLELLCLSSMSSRQHTPMVLHLSGSLLSRCRQGRHQCWSKPMYDFHSLARLQRRVADATSLDLLAKYQFEWYYHPAKRCTPHNSACVHQKLRLQYLFTW